MASPALAGTITLFNGTDGLFDNSSGFRDFTVTGLEPGYGTGEVLDVDISVNFAKADGESFAPPYPGGTPFYNEIHFRLDKGASQVELIAPNSWGTGSGQFDGTINFDDLAATDVNFGPAPVAGTFKPTGALGPGGGSLADFNTLLALGTWRLFVHDTVSSDALRFREATLTITTRDAPVAPEPVTMLLLGSGFVAVAARFRRRKA